MVYYSQDLFEFRSFSANLCFCKSLWTFSSELKKKVPVMFLCTFVRIRRCYNIILQQRNGHFDGNQIYCASQEVNSPHHFNHFAKLLWPESSAGFVKRKTHWLRFISSTLRMNANFLVLPESS